MSRKCQISGLRHQVGNRSSKANNKTKHVFKINLQTKRIFVPEENRFVRVKISTRLLRTIDKIGLSKTLQKYGLKLKDVAA